ncbi:MAG: hypothetical protein GOV15_03050, partial [Candidatus Diapherotrites archaeon]|nr:hypothetical protein [Candidatus Diapherotrites archaeon]
MPVSTRPLYAKPRGFKITEIVQEARDVKTFFFDCDWKVSPGQFVMTWLPGVDEKPFSVTYADGKRLGITVQRFGDVSAELHKLSKG